MFLSKQTHMFDYFIYHPESGWHVARPNQGLSLGRGKSLGTRLIRIFGSSHELNSYHQYLCQILPNSYAFYSS